MMIGSGRSLKLRQALACVILILGGRVFAQSASSEYDFNRDIRPILSGKCFRCHGPDAAAREADLRLDRREAAIEFGAFVPGLPEESELLNRVASSDPDLRMPPKGDPLSADQIAKLTSWIKDGATYEKHWSFQRPKRPGRPSVRDESWPVSELDYFILNRIEQARLQPSQIAEPAVLLRRLYLDLIGLPPSVEEIDAFEAEPSPRNFEAAVDRLLKSKHFGEKWAAGWLDLARYADSNGYQHDDLRTMWPYRDWVITALNNDMPYDRFTIEQLAGDLLPDPTTSQLVATGFNRNVPVNFSGGAKVPEVRANILHDRVATTGAVWLGLTLECAQCHDHKFDAVSQREYYQLYAYFNKAVPEVAQKSETMFRKLFVGREVVIYESDADQRKAEALSRTLAREESLLAKDKSQSSGEITILDFEGPNPVNANQVSHPADTSAVRDTPETGGKVAGKTVVKPAERDPGFFGTGFNFPTRDFSRFASIAFWIKTDIAGSFNFQVHNSDMRASVFGFSTAGAKPTTWTRVTARLDAFEKPPWANGKVDWTEVTKIQIVAYGNGPYAGKYIMLDNVVGHANSERDLQIKRIAQIREALDELQTLTMVMQDAKEPPVTHVMIRGDYATPGDRVDTGVLSALHPLDSSLPGNRLGLAKWLASPDNPLTARVAVNRIWAEIFGRGIVTTPEDFGMQGAAPSHPQLLDWLAHRFVEQGWSVKSLIKSIVMSSTFQQTSIASEALLAKDPANVLYARGPRFRLSAELVRDNLLAVSGLLSGRIGGPVVYPVQPDGLWMEILGVMDVKEYPTSAEVDRHRRGVYTVWRRGNPYPSMINFDAPERSVCTARRDRSNTPLQALTLLNDPAYVEMATKFAGIIWSWEGSDREKIVRAFRTAVSRRPTDDELMILLELRRKRGSWFAVAQALLNLDETITKS
jgi:Protein of unknown function (DUF1553)/Protein of unknown function (DUF1549)/Planctomycete cytochrome C